jgi:hypothetical protein
MGRMRDRDLTGDGNGATGHDVASEGKVEKLRVKMRILGSKVWWSLKLGRWV